ncbi:hypothetical protein EYE40_07605 [Glaciihabitans arcticus]|uniref:Signal transduction histidine kinase subgroup 3 dimerisation and phosphoacceptor domain-containing protein n=1 Tax=Glaciihabitans arcticus TaxID=2668039 RepID=A0A4Q9GX21_9MICO|nr:histidine kinase [Glaciihabitans arcticus]TBN57273.1 hypothetical protein EYE40_07605 [Glaciihabitans arcticus]
MTTSTGDRLLQRMRTYTTTSLVVMIGLFSLLLALGATEIPFQYVLLGAGVLITEFSFHWERRPPLWLAIVVPVVTGAVWVFVIMIGEYPATSVWLGIALSLLVSQAPQRRWKWLAPAALAVMLLPVAIIGLFTSFDAVSPYLVSGFFGWLGTMFLFLLNRWAFNLYLEIDAARQVSAELAVAQERYRFAADLHDIQGHTLHVIKLKTQLADRLIDRDPAAAREHLREAQQLIAETVANTRSLAFGERHVALASELANAEQLFTAAGIAYTVQGELPRGAHDELFGLVVREATTNILRHAQATAVSVNLGADSVRVVNDGSPASSRSLSGLARLGERFEAAGGTLRTSSANGSFTTTATVSG